MRTIALTGNIAAGKSTVTAILRDLGAFVIDADTLVRELQRPGTPVFQAMVARFGHGIVNPTGELDRAAMRALMLDDPHAKSDLEAIVHPAVAAWQRTLLAEASARGVTIAVVDIPLLFEVGDPERYDGIIVVDAPVAQRRQRLVCGRGLPADEADRLIALQLPAAAKRERATWLIDNDGDLGALADRVQAVWQSLQR